MIEYKPYLFFGIIISIILIFYYFFDKIRPYLPIKVIIILIGIISIFFPEIIKKIKEGYHTSDIKNYIYKKYKKN